DRLPARRGEPEHGRQRDANRDERHVADDELRREGQLAHLARVRLLEDDDALVGAQPLVQLMAADVERDHARRAALEEDVGEAAGRGADVEAVEARRVDAEQVEPVRELLAAARDVLRTAVDRELDVLVDLLARLVVPGHAARHHERLRLRARLGEAALDEDDVEPLLHASAAATRSASARNGAGMPSSRAYDGSSGIVASNGISFSNERSSATRGKTSIVSPQCGHTRPLMFSTAPERKTSCCRSAVPGGRSTTRSSASPHSTSWTSCEVTPLTSAAGSSKG